MEPVIAYPVVAKRNLAVPIFLTALLFAKLVLLFHFKPIFAPDTYAYTSYADIILQRGEPLTHINLHETFGEVTSFRMIGYPALIAASKAFGAQWPYILCLFQIALSLYASYALYVLVRQKGLSLNWALFATAAYSASYPLYLDQFILTDSMFTSLCVIFICKTDYALLSEHIPTSWECIKAGLAGAGFLLIRDTAPLVMLATVPLFLCALYKNRGFAGLKRVALVILPFFVTWTVYDTWNYLRSGIFFTTTATQTSFLYPIMKIAPHDPEILSGNDPVSKTAREIFVKYELSEVVEINRRLFKNYKLTTVQIAALSRKKYWDTAIHHPVLILRYAYQEAPWAILVAPFRTLETIKDVAEAASPTAYWASTRRLLERPPSTWKIPEVLFVILVNVSRLVGLAITLFFVLGALSRNIFDLIRRGKPTFTNLVLLSYCYVFLFYILAYAIVHIEDRYLIPAFALSSAFGTVIMRDYIVYRRAQNYQQEGSPGKVRALHLKRSDERDH